MTTLVKWLEKQQDSLHEIDAMFSRRLGISQSLWCRLRKGNRHPGLRVVQAALRAFPGKHAEIIRLAQGFPQRNDNVHHVRGKVA